MKKHLFLNAILLIAGLYTSSLFAQDWVSKMQDPKANFYDVQKSFNEYAANYRASYKLNNNGAEPVKIPGEKLFRRWEWKWAPRVSATGEFPAGDVLWTTMESYKKGIQTNGAGAWTFIGPSTTGSMSGAGRLGCVRVHPTNPNTIYVGSPAGGLWISTDGGSTWTTNTDNLPSVIGCTDIAIDPINTNIMYLATGDGDAGDNATVGVLKSIDGGTTWNKTGLTFAMGVGRMMSKILINPTNTNILIVVTSNGIYRSTDAGVTFSQCNNTATGMPVAGSFKDLEFKPGDPNTVYACGSEFFRSTNGGATWTKATGGPAAANVSRMAIAVTAADPTIVYMIAGLPGPNYGTEGFYKSTTSGASFPAKISTPSMGASPGQQWYDICVAANPTNASEILLGGSTIFNKSTNGGTSWSPIASSTHVDYHDAMYTSGTTCYLTSDGGVWKSTNNGSSWTDLSDGLAISQMYGFGQSTTNPNLLIQGWQDNGTNLYSGSSWTATNIGGDGMKAVISWGNDANKWGTSQYGRIMRSTGGSFSTGTTGITEYTGASPNPWITEIVEDPSTANTLYCGFSNVWKSTNGAASWTKLGTIGSGTVNVQSIAAVPTTNGQTVWAAKGGTLYKTTNGGTTWVAQAGGLPNGNISDIVVHATDVNKAWVTFSGFSNSIKVYGTSDQGTTWTNLSGSVPNVPVNCIAIDKNGNDALYIGTDVGVFYKDATMNIWQPFNQGLPNVIVTQLELYYAGSKIRASTYGRGMWESTLYAPGAYAPDANFTGNNLIGCPGLGVQFTDYSAGSPTSWAWSFPGGSPSSSTLQNPFIAYNTPGTYSVSLTVTNGVGNNTETFVNYITVSSSPNAAPTAPSYTICGPVTVTLTATPSAPGTVRWWNQAAGGTILASGNTYAPMLFGTQTLYIDEAFSSGGIDFVGAADKSIGAGDYFSASDIRGLYFDVFKPVVINSVKVYAQSAGLRTIEIIDENGNMVTDTTVNIPVSTTTPATVVINRTVYPGKNYFIKFRGTVNCFRNSSGPAYPYDDGGSAAVRITNSNAGSAGYYYFFYDWQFTNIVCNTGRTPVQITDNCSLTGVNDLFSNGSLDIYPNPNNGQFTVAFNLEMQDNYTLKITNAIGQNVYEETLNGFSGNYKKQLDITTYGKGVYQLSITNSKNETVKKVMVY